MNNRILTTLFALALCLPLFIGVVPVEADAADSCAHATYETIWQKDATCTETGIKLTYDRCLNCGKAFSDAAHTKEVNPDYLVTPDKGGHKWQTVSDATTHWEKCSVCGTERNVVAHTANGWVQTSVGHKQVCTVCNATLPNTEGVHVAVYKDSGDGINHHAECQYCGYKTGDDVAHNFTCPEKDKNGHTATCQGCGYTVVQEHVDEKKSDNSEGKDCKCDMCGFELEHKAGEELKHSTNWHWNECVRCGTQMNPEEHDFSIPTPVEGRDDKHAMACECGALRNQGEAHTWEKVVTAEKHTYTCKDCGKEHTNTGAHVDAYKANGSAGKDCVCDICGYEIPHDFSDYSTSTDTHHHAKCSACGEWAPGEQVEHSFGKWEKVDGKHVNTCSVCKKPVEIAKCKYDAETHKCTMCGEPQKHTWDKNATYVAPKAATCTEKGNVEHEICKTCKQAFDYSGKVLAETVIPELGHDWKNEMTISGKHLQRCETCGVYEYQEHTSSTGGCTCDIVLKNGKVCGQLVHSHDAVKVPRKAPTCQEEGYEAYWKYEACGRMFKNDFARTEIDAPITIPVVDHEPGEWVNEGDEHVKCCEVCGEELESGEHVDANFDNRCDVCKFELTLELVEEVPATCTESGTKAYYISRVTDRSYWDEAGTQYISNADEKLIPALGHDDYVHDLENGKHQVKCDRCERTLTAEDHTFSGCFCTKCGAANGTHTATTFERVEATCDKDGHLAYAKCSCGKFYNVLGEETTYSALVLKASGHKWGTEIFNDNAAGKHYAVCETCNAKNYSEHELTVNDPLSGNYHQFVCKCGKVTTEVHYDRNGDKVCDVKGCEHDMSNKKVTVNNNPSTTVVTGDKNTVNNRWSWLKNWLNNTKPSTAGGSEKPEQAAKPDGAGTGSPSGNTVVPPSSGSTTTPATGSNTGSTGAGSSNAGSSTQGGSQTAEATGVLQYVISFFNWIFSGFGG